MTGPMALSEVKDIVDDQLGVIIDLVRSGLGTLKMLEKVINFYKRGVATEQTEVEEILDDLMGDSIDIFRSGLGNLKILEKSVTIYRREIKTQQAQVTKYKAQAVAEEKATKSAEAKPRALKTNSSRAKDSKVSNQPTGDA